MPLSVRSSTAALVVAIAPVAGLLLAGVSFDASALSRRDQQAVDALNQRVQAAETKYRESIVKIGNADPEGIAQSNAALEDIEDVIVECGKQRGCSVGTMLAAYKRLLKANADAAGEDDTVTGDEPPDTSADGVPQSASAASLLSADGQRLVRLVQNNPAVQAGIRRWLTDMRVALITSHENYQYMRHLMSPSFQRNGLPEALLFGIMAKESNGRVHAGSRVGATGPLQFMPATGRRFGLGPDGTGFDTRYDPRASADAAASYLNERFAELNNDIEMSLAAYNGGEGRALRVFRASGGRSFWDTDVYNQFPAETKDYVPMVIAAAWLYLHPKEYGLVFPSVDARPATLRLARAASIYELTICLGNGGTRDGYMRALRNLNPRYEADQFIPAGTTLQVTARMAGLYNRHCVSGARADLARTLVLSDARNAVVSAGPLVPVTAPPTPLATATQAPRDYPVQRGETLYSIAGKFQCDVATLASANDIRGPRYAIRPGQVLKLEGCKG